MDGREGPPCEVRLPTPGAEREGHIYSELGVEREHTPDVEKLNEIASDVKRDEVKVEEELDPRIQEELERLNQASEEINLLELQLDEARTAYRRILSESARRLKTLATQLGACIEKARPYYEARRLAKEAQQDTHSAALRYERAVSMHAAAREMVFVAEQGVTADKNRLDPTWQEMLNHATCKVNEAEEERLRSEFEHQHVTRLCHEAEAKVQTLQKSLKRVIIKSRPYFELKVQFNTVLEEHKSRVTSLEISVTQAKLCYSGALRNLELISEEIHARRNQGLLLPHRAPPLGAEAPPSLLDRELDPQADTVSLLSLLTIASDLQKSDSVEHLRGLTDVTSLDGRDTGEGEGARSREGRGERGSVISFGHHRSVSL
ncbi:LOW QUALITY PROTEIN: SH3 domain-binding protein 5-like [Bombina bombina]|uniref:LOW QUALITY PROTEIN: SH3 domain-binding protein 5-like n=1 Tax=Bombina bombina TaxID=8345 RepID=UPI00235B0846|nr:LOW QUALITY PROTEIN: SH3 domain-binding protein 5-like [Bombina bombina]